MNFKRRWWFLIYLVVLGLGSVLSIYFYQQGQNVRDEILRLSNDDIVYLHRIADLKQAVTAREPILYRYYADTDRDSYLTSYSRNTKRVKEGMEWLARTFADNPELAELQSEHSTLQKLAKQLDQVLTAESIDWDEARRILGDVAVVSRSLNNRLERFARSVERQVAERGNYVSAATLEMFYSVVAVSVVIFILALFFGHYAYQHLSGTGFSSLAYLKQFPIQTLKIDQSFVKQLEQSPPDRAIVRSIIELGHHLGFEIVAEGVETLAQKQMLGEYSCDTLQDYLFSRPVPPGEYEKLFLEKRPDSSNKREIT